MRPSLIVLHGTVGTDSGDLAWLRSERSGVSYHYMIQRTGAIHRLVRPEKRAWHAGKSAWKGVQDVNDFSIGVGLSNLGGDEPYTAAQYEAAGELCAVLMRVWKITLEGVVGHYHISPGRKTDPWNTWEWMRLAAEIVAPR